MRQDEKVKYLTWRSVTLKFVKKTSKSNPVEILGYFKRPTKFYQVQLPEADRKDLKLYWKSEKSHISRYDEQVYYLSVF